MLYSYIKKLHVSAGSGHHQVLSFHSLKIVLHNSRGGAFDKVLMFRSPHQTRRHANCIE